jgi:hypothetical protein
VSSNGAQIAAPDLRFPPQGPRAMLIHVGYPKASSTFLQERLFRADHGYCPLYPSKDDRAYLNTVLVEPSAFRFDAPAFRRETRFRLARLQGRDLVPVVSAESLVGSQLDPTAGLSKIVAERIAETCPDARILMIVREQYSMMLSIYFQYVRGGGIRSLEEFVNAGGIPVHRHPSWSGVYPQFLEYDQIVRHYHRLFGAERVLVLPLELLSRDSREYVARITAFSGSRTDLDKIDYSVVKGGIPPNIIWLRRFANAFLSSNPDNPFTYLMPAPLYWRGARHAKRFIEQMGRNADVNRATRKFRDRLDGVFGGRFADSNRSVAELTGLDLKNLGYQM